MTKTNGTIPVAEAPVGAPITLPASLTTALLEAGRTNQAFMARLSGFIEGAALASDENYSISLGGPLLLTKVSK